MFQDNKSNKIVSKRLKLIIILCSFVISFVIAADDSTRERKIKIAGFGATSGTLQSLGINSRAVLEAAVEQINIRGITTGDGVTADLDLSYYDSACNLDTATSVINKIIETDAIVGMGPTCSGVAEVIYGHFQKKVDSLDDSGLQFPILADTPMKIGLAKKSEWVFRNVANEWVMYDKLFDWVQTKYPNLKTYHAGIEIDQGHSKATWSKVIKVHADKHGYKQVGEEHWSMRDTSFSVQSRKFSQSNADIIIISAHPPTTCGILKELALQKITPKILIGLTSSASPETALLCTDAAEGITIPTSFYPASPLARKVVRQAALKGGNVDLHSAAAWENAEIIKRIIQDTGIIGKPETLKEDRRKMRDGLAALKSTKGLLGIIERTADGEAMKPYFIVQLIGGEWSVVHNPN